MAVFIAREGEDRLPPLPLDDTTSVQPQVHKELNELRASIESTIEQHLHERVIASLLSSAHAVLEQRATSPFYAVNGAQYNTIRELAAGAKHLAPHEFSHHVNEQRNDFANWIEGCFAEPAKKLAAVIRGKSRDDILELLQHLEEYSVLPQPKPAPQPMHEPPSYEPAFVPRAQRVPFEPLPPPPASLPTPAEHIHEELDHIRKLMRTDMPAAREHFINLRTYVWQQLGERDRSEVLPALREVYTMLISAGMY